MIGDLGHNSSHRITIESEVEIIFRKDQFLDPVVNGDGIGWLVALSPSDILSGDLGQVPVECAPQPSD